MPFGAAKSSGSLLCRTSKQVEPLSNRDENNQLVTIREFFYTNTCCQPCCRTRAIRLRFMKLIKSGSRSRRLPFCDGPNNQQVTVSPMSMKGFPNDSPVVEQDHLVCVK